VLPGGFDELAQSLDGAVDEIARDDHEVGRESVRFTHDVLDEPTTDGGTDVDVGELDDRIAR